MATNPYQGIPWIQFENNPLFIPLPDDGGPGPVPEGTRKQYGVATWIPDGYPIATQPFLDLYGRIILRPFRKINVPDQNTLNIYTAYVATALQYAVNKYAPVPYNVLDQTSLYSGAAIIQSYFLFPAADHFAMLGRMQIGSWDPDFANPKFAQPTFLDQAQAAGKSAVLSVFKTGANLVVPGLGTQLEDAVNKASGGGLFGVSSLAQSQATTSQVSAMEKSLISSSDAPNYLLYGAAAIVIIILILLISK